MFARDSGVPTSAPAILTPCLTCLRKQTDDEFLQFGRLEALDDGSLEFLVILVNYGLRLDPIRTESRRVLSRLDAEPQAIRPNSCSESEHRLQA